MQAAHSNAPLARLSPVGVVGFVPTVHPMHSNPTGMHLNKWPSATWNMSTKAHPMSGSKKPNSLN